MAKAINTSTKVKPDFLCDPIAWRLTLDIPCPNSKEVNPAQNNSAPRWFLFRFKADSLEFRKGLLEEGNLWKGNLPSMLRPLAIGLLLALVITGPTWADPVPGEAAEVLAQRRRLAAADTRLAATWISSAYEVPDRVAEELLFSGYSYAETLIAMAFMGEGLSLNEVLEQRRLRGGARWEEVGKVLGLRSDRLPAPISQLLWFGRNSAPAAVLHFLPDPHPGIIRDLVIPAFEPTVPDMEAQRRFRLNKQEVANIRRVLDDPLGVPEKDLLLPAGRGLDTGDWVLAGTISYFKPFPMESLLAARVGEDLPWNEIAMAFGLRPDVLTQGPLAGVYPVVTGYTPNTILIARKREQFPKELPLHYDLERLTPGEKRALEPLLYRHYSATSDEQILLGEKGLDMADRGLALAMARMAGLDLSIILDDYAKAGQQWQAIVTKYSIDLTGHQAIKSVIALRSGR